MWQCLCSRSYLSYGQFGALLRSRLCMQDDDWSYRPREDNNEGTIQAHAQGPVLVPWRPGFGTKNEQRYCIGTCRHCWPCCVVVQLCPSTLASPSSPAVASATVTRCHQPFDSFTARALSAWYDALWTEGGCQNLPENRLGELTRVEIRDSANSQPFRPGRMANQPFRLRIQ